MVVVVIVIVVVVMVVVGGGWWWWWMVGGGGGGSVVVVVVQFWLWWCWFSGGGGGGGASVVTAVVVVAVVHPRIDLLMSNCCSYKTLLHFSPQSSHLSNLLLPTRSAPRPVSPRLVPKVPLQIPMPSYSLLQHMCNIDRTFVTHLSAIHFRGQSTRQVSGYTLLIGFQLP